METLQRGLGILVLVSGVLQSSSLLGVEKRPTGRPSADRRRITRTDFPKRELPKLTKRRQTSFALRLQGTANMYADGKSDDSIVCAGQRMSQEG